MGKKIKTIIDQKLEEIFNMPPSEDEPVEGEIVEQDKKNPLDSISDIDTDYEYARSNLYELIEGGSNALNDLIQIASQSQSPRAFEIVSQLINTLTNANKDLLDVQNKVKKLKEDNNTPQNVTNALFIGNTTELQKMIKDRKKDV